MTYEPNPGKLVIRRFSNRNGISYSCRIELNRSMYQGLSFRDPALPVVSSKDRLRRLEWPFSARNVIRGRADPGYRAESLRIVAASGSGIVSALGFASR
jgi:hypothetical protein